MTWTEYLNRRKWFSINGSEVVKYQGAKYHPAKYEQGFDKGVEVHTAILLDLSKRSVVHARLSEVER